MGQGPPRRDIRGGNIILVKSDYLDELRCFYIGRDYDKFEVLHRRVESVHQIHGLEFIITYIDPIHGDLLPINNDGNFAKAKTSLNGNLLRIYVHNRETFNQGNGFGQSTVRKKKGKKLPPRIGFPEDFRPVSALIDVDKLPETLRRVRLHRHGSDNPLGFYIRDGVTLRLTLESGLEKVPGIFISRFVPGGLAERTGLLTVNDEVLEVNGIEVSGKTLDQVSDMMIANSSNLIITVQPASTRIAVTGLEAPSKGHFHEDIARRAQEESDEKQDVVEDIPTGPVASKPDDFLKPVENQSKKAPKHSTVVQSTLQSSPIGSKDSSPLGTGKTDVGVNQDSPNQSPRFRRKHWKESVRPKRKRKCEKEQGAVKDIPTGPVASIPDNSLKPVDNQSKKAPTHPPAKQSSTVQSSSTGPRDSSPLGTRKTDVGVNHCSPNQSPRSRQKHGNDSVRPKRKRKSEEEQDVVKDIPTGPVASKPDDSLQPVEHQSKKAPTHPPTVQSTTVQSSPTGFKDSSSLGARKTVVDVNHRSPNHPPRFRRKRARDSVRARRKSQISTWQWDTTVWHF